jgi:predicted exporter
MKRYGAWLWLAALVLTAAWLALRLSSGILLESNILALLPPTERDAAAQNVQDRIARAFSSRVIFLVGDPDAAKARAAALRFSAALVHSGLISALTSKLDTGAERRMAAAYYPYRTGLLAEEDREHLLANDAGALVSRALSILYGPAGFANAKLIAHDPFLLLPAWFLALPLPQSRLAADDGVLSVRDGNDTYVLVSAILEGDPYVIRFQTRFTNFVSRTIGALQAGTHSLKVLRTGAVFYAQQAAQEAMNETSIIGFLSVAATLAVILIVFHGLRPILLGFLAIGAGVLCAFVGTLLVFGQIHIVALLFGVSLIGISVDYSLQYFCEYFDSAALDPEARLRRVLPGVCVGLVTTLIGYCTLLLAPFPGLRQVAVFSLIGLIASCLTVALWYPALDTRRPPRPDNGFVAFAARHWVLWEKPGLWPARAVIAALCVASGLAGMLVLHTDDDVRHLQSLSSDLKSQQSEVERLTGSSPGTQFLLVRGTDEQNVLEKEEKIAERLSRVRRALGGFTTMAQFVPSIARQKENLELVRTRLMTPHLAAYLARTGYEGKFDYSATGRFLRPEDLPRTGPLSLLSILDIAGRDHRAHIVLLQNVTNPAGVEKAIDDIGGVRLVRLPDEWSRLFADYRRYAIGLLGLSAALMYPMLGWRYGWVSGLRVMAPSLLAVALAPPLAALGGVAFTFFNAMALVLVLSIGVDYAVFCRETSGVRKPVTMLAILLAALSTIFSFGMLAFSRVFAVHAFGMTMLIGISLAFLFAPAAGDGESGMPRKFVS